MKRLPRTAARVAASLLAALASSVAAASVADPSPLDHPPDPRAPYLDPALPIDRRVDDLIGRLTLEEKATLLNHNGPAVERFGIRADKWNQCLHGVWWDRPSTMFPVSIALAATFDPPLVHGVATAISDEARAVYNGWHLDPAAPGEHKGLIYRAPVINISRNPYWGRINECYGEDPFLTGRIGVAYVTGLQGDDPKYLKLAATLKHYAVNNVEKNRQGLSASVKERWLYEFWLPHFRDCVVEGKACSVMSSYNAINGVPNNRNPLLLTEILKQKWGFQGFVVSDLGAVRTMVTGHEKGKMSYEQAVAQSIVAGGDFSDKEFMENIPPAVRDGYLPQARLDDALRRVLTVRFRLGEFDSFDAVPYSKIPTSSIGAPEHRELAREAARKSIVLLSNRDHLLPLDRGAIKRIAVIGPHENLFTAGGYSGKPIDPVKPIDGVRHHVAAGTEVIEAVGAEITPPKRGTAALDKPAALAEAVAAAKRADVVLLYVGTTIAVEGEGHDRPSLDLPGNQEELAEAVIAANPKTVVVLINAGPLTIPWIKEHAAAVVEAWWGGEAGGDATADVLFGDAEPGGRLPYTVYASAAQVPPQDEYDPSKGFTYMYVKGEPLWPFGFGLSYTTFAYSNVKLSSATARPGETVNVSVDVANTGPRDGDEVVQIYAHSRHADDGTPRPAKKLQAFGRVRVKAGQHATVTLPVQTDRMAIYDEATHAFVVEPGEYDLTVGPSSAEAAASVVLTVGR